MAYAKEHPETTFMVTRIGCGLAGFKDGQIAPLFDDAPSNCMLPGLWVQRRDPGVARLIVAGSRSIRDRACVFRKLTSHTTRIHRLSGFEIVSGLATGPDTFAVEWAREAGFAGSVVAFPALWDRHARSAGHVRNRVMAWYATHLLAFWDGESPGTRGMIDEASACGLSVRVLQLGDLARSTGTAS